MHSGAASALYPLPLTVTHFNLRWHQYRDMNSEGYKRGEMPPWDTNFPFIPKQFPRVVGLILPICSDKCPTDTQRHA